MPRLLWRRWKGWKTSNVSNRGIQDLTGLQFATNLDRLILGEWWREDNVNQISDLSPIAGLTNLRELRLDKNPVSDLSPLKSLKSLISLGFDRTQTRISDLSPLAGLINLEGISFSHGDVSDLSPIAGLINLRTFHAVDNPISDLSPFAGLTKLELITIYSAKLSDLSPLAGLTGLKELHLPDNDISDISPLAGLTGLNRLGLAHNDISDISPLAGLTNLKWLGLYDNEISDLSPLDGLRENIKLIWHSNPGFPTDAPKIEGPWLWVLLPEARLNSSTDLLSEASGGTVTEVEIATHGAIEGGSVGEGVWTSYKLPPAGEYNIQDMLKRTIPDGVIYGTLSLYSPREQNTTMYVGSEDELKVWLNGTLIYEGRDIGSGNDYQDFFPVKLQQGRNVLLVAVRLAPAGKSAFLGLNRAPNIQWQPPVSATLFPRCQFTSAIPLLLISVQKLSSTWRGGNLISSSTPPPLKLLT